MIEDIINNALKDLCDGRVTPLVASQDTQTPYICYTKVSETFNDVMSGQSSVKYCLKIDVYAKTLLESETIKNQAFQRIKPLRAFNIVGSQAYERETELYRSTLEFYIQ